MAILFFDNPKGIILVDGNVCDGKKTRVGEKFCIQYFPFDPSLCQVYCAVNNKPKLFDDVIFIRHRGDYIVRFNPKKKIAEKEDVYLQKILQPPHGAMHCLTCHKDSCHKLSIETQSELITLALPCRAIDAKFSCAPLTVGQLLFAKIILENEKIYACVLHYGDDYTTLLSLCCDEISIDSTGVTVCDDLCDSLGRRCVRKLRFCGDCFVEESRLFENVCNHNYIDEIIPYIFVESIGYGDNDCALNCLCPTLRNCNLQEILGDFIGICDCLDYKEYEICLLYSDESGLYTKTFRFDIERGKIQKVKCL